MQSLERKRQYLFDRNLRNVLSIRLTRFVHETIRHLKEQDESTDSWLTLNSLKSFRDSVMAIIVNLQLGLPLYTLA